VARPAARRRGKVAVGGEVFTHTRAALERLSADIRARLPDRVLAVRAFHPF